MAREQKGKLPVTIYRAAGKAPWDSDRLLRQVAAQWAAAQGLALPAPLEICRQRGAKPRFAPPMPLEVSVTHSGAYWLCAASLAPVGLDLQQRRPVQAEKLARRFFHPLEAACVARRPAIFFDLWAAKESFVKYTGQGITSAFSAFSVVQDGELAPRTQGAFLQILPFQADYTLCLCTGAEAQVTWEELP